MVVDVVEVDLDFVGDVDVVLRMYGVVGVV